MRARLKENDRVLFREKPWKVILVNDARAVLECEASGERISVSNSSDLELVHEGESCQS